MAKLKTRDQILNAAETLFMSKGYDKTSINDIQKVVGIARGTLYHHFNSKEEIMDVIIERKARIVIDRAKEVVQDEGLTAVEKLKETIKVLNMPTDAQTDTQTDADKVMDHLHKPQNALMHEKINTLMLNEVIPLLSSIVEEGIEEGSFHSAYPDESTEMLVLYAKYAFDDATKEKEADKYPRRVRAFVHNTALLLGIDEKTVEGLIQ